MLSVIFLTVASHFPICGKVGEVIGVCSPHSRVTVRFTSAGAERIKNNELCYVVESSGDVYDKLGHPLYRSRLLPVRKNDGKTQVVHLVFEGKHNPTARQLCSLLRDLKNSFSTDDDVFFGKQRATVIMHLPTTDCLLVGPPNSSR